MLFLNQPLIFKCRHYLDFHFLTLKGEKINLIILCSKIFYVYPPSLNLSHNHKASIHWFVCYYKIRLISSCSIAKLLPLDFKII